MLDSLAKYDLRINTAALSVSPRDTAWHPPAVVMDYDLMAFTSGVATVQINGQQHTVTPHDILLMRRGDRMENPVAAGRVSNYLVHFDFLGKNGKPADPPDAILPPRRPSHANHLVISHLIGAMLQMGEMRQLAARTMLLRTILLLLAGDKEGPVRDFSVRHRSKLFAELTRRMLEDPVPRRSVPDLADEAGMSPVQFTRCFRKETGYAPGEFMVLARIERAKLLLATTSRTVTDIADSLNYSDVYYFTRQFADKTGSPPAAYRKNPKGKRPRKSG